MATSDTGPVRREPLTCGHCGRTQDGYAAIGNTPLCHPDIGMDCYKLVALYGHATPCGECKLVTAPYPAGSES